MRTGFVTREQGRVYPFGTFVIGWGAGTPASDYGLPATGHLLLKLASHESVITNGSDSPGVAVGRWLADSALGQRSHGPSLPVGLLFVDPLVIQSVGGSALASGNV